MRRRRRARREVMRGRRGGGRIAIVAISEQSVGTNTLK
jgi:hypothetical protein